MIDNNLCYNNIIIKIYLNIKIKRYMLNPFLKYYIRYSSIIKSFTSINYSWQRRNYKPSL